jgi:hypothetical protein
VLRGKKNFARPREKRKKHTFLREKKRFSVKEKCRATKKEKVIVALHPSERESSISTMMMTRISFLLFRKNSFLIITNALKREKERKRT